MLGITFFACNNKQQSGQQAVPDYAVMTVEPEDVVLTSSYPATIRGRQDVEIRPNVSGFITKLCVDEGANVRKGQTLFIIDPVQYEEAVNVARAAVSVAEAGVATAQLTADNKRELANKNIISNYDYRMAENALVSQKAALAQAEAQLVNAEKNLSYTSVVSPVDGVMGSIPFRVGALVSPTSATPLTTVSDISEMYVYFSMTEKELLDLIRQGGSSKEILERMPLVSLSLADGSLYSEQGRIETISGVIDQTTGAVSVRAAFRNPRHLLRSGGTGSVVIPSTLKNALVIPQKATYEIQDKRFVYVLQEDAKLKNTEIEVFKLNDGKNFVVTSGLKPGDKIVAEGVGTLRDGMQIKPITLEESAAKLKAMTRPKQN
ncbi:efflux RND transporter periplasmic adaptor subunit [Gabonibacter chumensis]|uniref:efflux RND transporter periplasmic adaptor subunit n=1 Tax=Gabonibacter chumensis TaxID=2972474 RepID=UPI002572C6D3|nr:efflux RND transporter periplasmic adaptor subunit [Gabonibacter chumensis]MCR9012019.1 efflux RND transporter periplasmic adaptor subunit [Gabonibacter chumensis]